MDTREVYNYIEYTISVIYYGEGKYYLVSFF